METPKYVTRLGQAWRECPRRWIGRKVPMLGDWIRDLAFLHQHGVLPRAGGRLDQDPRWLQGIEEIESEGQLTRRLLAAGGDGT